MNRVTLVERKHGLLLRAALDGGGGNYLGKTRAGGGLGEHSDGFDSQFSRAFSGTPA
jgi:hypothetical protein